VSIPEDQLGFADWVTVAKLPFDPDDWQATVELRGEQSRLHRGR
jgi:hypothetical protein